MKADIISSNKIIFCSFNFIRDIIHDYDNMINKSPNNDIQMEYSKLKLVLRNLQLKFTKAI